MEPHPYLLVWLATASFAAFLAMAVDKARAQAGRGRISERTLLALALVGGTPGLVTAMLLVRHKTRKASFLLRLLGVVLLQLALAYVAARA